MASFFKASTGLSRRAVFLFAAINVLTIQFASMEKAWADYEAKHVYHEHNHGQNKPSYETLDAACATDIQFRAPGSTYIGATPYRWETDPTSRIFGRLQSWNCWAAESTRPITAAHLWGDCPPGVNGGYWWAAYLCEGTPPPDWIPSPPAKDKRPGGCDRHTPCQQSRGNPINLGTGGKYLEEVDYAAAGVGGLTMRRHYSSYPGATTLSRKDLGVAWRHHYERSIHAIPGTSSRVVAVRPDGKVYEFALTQGTWLSDSDVTDRLVRLSDSSGALTGWRYTSDEDVVENYDASGRLLSLANRAGVSRSLTYDAQGRLTAVTDLAGLQMTFAYSAANRLAGFTVGGHTTTYSYASTGVLNAVSYPDGRSRLFHYEDPEVPWALTGITDENGSRYSTYAYDLTSNRATLSKLANDVGKITIQYSGGMDSVATVTDALGTIRTFTQASVNGVPKNVSLNLPCTDCAAAAYGYDPNGFIAHKIDFNGNRTNYTHSTRGLETQRVEGLTSAGATTAVTRTIATEWHADYRLPLRIAEPLRRTTFTYGAPTDPNPGNRGSVLTKTVQATTDANGSLGFGAALTGSARTWTYTYNGNGQVLTVNGPRTDVSDVTTYTYHPNTATCAADVTGASATGCRAQLNTVTNAAGHVTTVSHYDAHGQPLRIVDPNGLVTTLQYDARMRLTSRSIGGEVTAYTYDYAGLLKRVTQPDASYVDYTYDPAHRLTEIKDNLGNRIAYTLDLMGNRTAENIYDPANALTQARTREYNSLNRLWKEIGAAGQVSTFGYDTQGNLTSVDGPLSGTGDTTVNAYDALNRLIRVTDPNAGQVNYGYNGQDNLTSVSDPRSLATTYSYDGLTNLNSQVSPDTGTTTNTYDLAGNLLTSTDAKGQRVQHTYDALNRVTQTQIYAPGNVLSATHTFAYDGGTNQKGRLTQITEPASTTVYTYDQQGRVTGEARTINGVAYSTAYGYDAQGRLNTITYPGGRQLSYSFDSLGRVQGVTTTKAGVQQTVVSNIVYRPFGPPRGFTFGNGQTYSRGFDNDGRVSSYTLGTQTMAVGYDLASRITSLNQAGTTANNNTYGYDVLDRLTSYVGPSVNQGFGYDVVGNRRTKTVGAASATYNYPAGSNRLSNITGSGARTFTHDAAGSITADGVGTYTYDSRGRMVRAVSAAGTTDYKINALGQRIRKTNPQGDTVYHYDTQGRLIAESAAAGTIQKEYVYLGDIPVAVLQ